MGLDMYLRGDKFVSSWDHSQRDENGIPLEVKRPQMDGFEVTSYVLDLGYWRKFAPLHTFIVKVFANGEDNCQPIDLGAEDLRRIAAAIRDGNLPDDEDSTGFFLVRPSFGMSTAPRLRSMRRRSRKLRLGLIPSLGTPLPIKRVGKMDNLKFDADESFDAALKTMCRF